MQKQWGELVQTDALVPPVRQRGQLVVGRDDIIEVGVAKEREHREVALRVTAMGHGIDECPARLRLRRPVPQDVSRPEVSVQARAGDRRVRRRGEDGPLDQRGLLGIEGAVRNAGGHALEQCALP